MIEFSPSDACHAKMLESKRTLDGLLQKEKQLGTEIDGENSIIEGNTATIKDALQKKKEAEETKAKEIETCTKIAEESRAEELGKIQKEITQMRQIADPQVRSRVKFDTDYGAKATEIADEKRTDAEIDILSQGLTDQERDEIMQNAASLTQVATKFTLTKNDLLSLVSVDLGRCKDFKNLIDEVGRSHSLQLDSPECEEARSNLQKEFTIAFNEITSLYDRTACSSIHRNARRRGAICRKSSPLRSTKSLRFTIAQRRRSTRGWRCARRKRIRSTRRQKRK